MRPGAFRPFHEIRVENVFNQAAENLAAVIEAMPATEISNRNEDDLADELAERHGLAVPAIDFGARHLEEAKVQVPAERFPVGYGVVRGKTYERDALLVHVPYSGDPVFLRCYESTKQITGHLEFWLSNGRLTFEVFAFELTAEFITAECTRQFRFLETYLGFVASAVRSYNDGLPDRLRQLITKRKKKLHAKATMLAQLGIPLSPTTAPPVTMAVAAPVKRRTIVVSMTAGVAGRVPDPTLDEKLYGEILESLATKARAMERTPQTYAALGEEDIRNHLLEGLMLAFGTTSVTGETFNKKGKTDILIRHEGHNLFVGECKIWKGRASYLAAITQVLGYLTWRDSKAALLVFVRGTDLAKAESVIRDATSAHSKFVREDVAYRDGVVRYTFELDGAEDKHVRVAVLLFHLPR